MAESIYSSGYGQVTYCAPSSPDSPQRTRSRWFDVPSDVKADKPPRSKWGPVQSAPKLDNPDLVYTEVHNGYSKWNEFIPEKLPEVVCSGDNPQFTDRNTFKKTTVEKATPKKRVVNLYMSYPSTTKPVGHAAIKPSATSQTVAQTSTVKVRQPIKNISTKTVNHGNTSSSTTSKHHVLDPVITQLEKSVSQNSETINKLYAKCKNNSASLDAADKKALRDARQARNLASHRLSGFKAK